MIIVIMRVLLIAVSTGTIIVAQLGKSAEDQYVFAPDVDRLVGIVRGDFVLIGRLDLQGNFSESMRRVPGPVSSALPPYTIINSFAADLKPRPVYEYRSGRLIKGVIDLKCNFVPDVGSTVILFKDYRYSPKALPIWNLPGRFVKKAK